MTGTHGETQRKRCGRGAWGPAGVGGGELQIWAIPGLLLQATIACVVIVLKAWRPRAPGPPRLCAGAAAFAFRAFFFVFFSSPSSLWSVRCLCSRGEGQFEEKYGRRKTLAWPRSCVTSPLYHRPAVFFFFVFCFFGVFALSSPSLSLCHAWIWKTGNAEEFTSSLILAMGSWPENTSSNFCLYWSSCVFSACCSSHQAPSGFFGDHSPLSKSPPRPSIFLFSLHSGLKDFIWPHPGLHSDFYQMLLSWFNPCQRKKKEEEEEKGFREEQIIITSV